MTPRRQAPAPDPSSSRPRFGADDLAQFRARLEALRAEQAPPTAETVYQAYTDGACIGNPSGPGGWGALFARYGGGEDLAELWGHLSSTSNNRAEILGVLAALEWAPARSTLFLYADSQYTLNVLSGAFKARANLDLWTAVRRAIAEKGLTIHPEWVRGHAGNPGNERADRLAMLGALKGDRRRVVGLDAPLVLPGGETELAAEARRPPRLGRTPDHLPPELVGLAPRGHWEASFLQSVARQLRAGRALSQKQQAVVERIRRRAPGAPADGS